jgi:hypothetical protein
MMDTVIVRDREGKQEEILSGLDYSTFQVDKEMNTTWQIAFTAYKTADSILAFNLIQPKSLVKWHDQWFSVEQPTMDVTDGVASKQITAIHVWFSCSRIRPNITPASTDDDSPAKSYTAEQLMKLAFDGNKFGYTWEIKGKSDTTQIDSMDRQSALDILNNYLIGQMGWVITADNYKIYAQSLDSFKRKTGKVINYFGDASNVNIQPDVTSIVNACRMYGKDNKYLGEYVNQESIDQYGKWYGDDVTSDTATKASDVTSAAGKSVDANAVPNETMTTTYRGSIDDIELGDVVTVNCPPLDFSQELMCSHISATPYTHEPITITWTTGTTNKANIKSLLQMQYQLNTQIKNVSKQSNKQVIIGATTIDGGASVVRYDAGQ